MALQVGGERLIELRSAADALRNEQRNYRCCVPLLNLSLLPFLYGPRGFTDVIDGVAMLHTGEVRQIDSAAIQMPQTD